VEVPTLATACCTSRSGVPLDLEVKFDLSISVRGTIVEDGLVVIGLIVTHDDSSRFSSPGSSMIEGQLERELSSQDLLGVLEREVVLVVFEERDCDEGRAGSCSLVCFGNVLSSSMTPTTCPSGATTS